MSEIIDELNKMSYNITVHNKRQRKQTEKQRFFGKRTVFDW